MLGYNWINIILKEVQRCYDFFQCLLKMRASTVYLQDMTKNLVTVIILLQFKT